MSIAPVSSTSPNQTSQLQDKPQSASSDQDRRVAASAARALDESDSKQPEALPTSNIKPWPADEVALRIEGFIQSFDEFNSITTLRDFYYSVRTSSLQKIPGHYDMASYIQKVYFKKYRKLDSVLKVWETHHSGVSHVKSSFFGAKKEYTCTETREFFKAIMNTWRSAQITYESKLKTEEQIEADTIILQNLAATAENFRKKTQ